MKLFKKLSKLMASLAIFSVLAGSVFTFILPNDTFAADCNGEFLLVPAWYRGLTTGDNCDIKPISQKEDAKSGSVTLSTFIWTVVLNISDGLFRLAGVISTGFIIWAGFQYMISQGNPTGISNAKTTLTNAIIGLIISILAISITNFVIGIIK